MGCALERSVEARALSASISFRNAAGPAMPRKCLFSDLIAGFGGLQRRYVQVKQLSRDLCALSAGVPCQGCAAQGAAAPQRKCGI